MFIEPRCLEYCIQKFTGWRVIRGHCWRFTFDYHTGIVYIIIYYKVERSSYIKDRANVSRLLNSEGRSYSFDSRATGGFGRGEGTGCIIIKPLKAALEAGDPIRAILRNTGVNQDGKTAGITMPNGKAQMALIRDVYSSLGLNPLDTDYIEAHGTGTAIGDPIEAAALGEVFTSEVRKTTIGSLKSNIGHLEGASGICSVIKAALMLERKFLLPNCDLQTPNRKISFEKSNMKVRTLREYSNRLIQEIQEHCVLSPVVVPYSSLTILAGL